MKYPFIKIILIEFWVNMRKELLSNDVHITRVTSSVHNNYTVLGVRFTFNEERMLDLPLTHYQRRFVELSIMNKKIKQSRLSEISDLLEKNNSYGISQ